jgi:hypothetical protein
MESGGTAYIKSFMKINIDVEVILRSCLSNFKVYHDGTTGGSDL